MSKNEPKRRKSVIKSRKKRKAKLGKLRERYFLAKTPQEKRKIIEKALRINPSFSGEEFLASLQEKPSNLVK